MSPINVATYKIYNRALTATEVLQNYQRTKIKIRIMITYITINMSEIALVDFNQVLETSEETVRLSVDGLQTVLKWEGAEPSFVSTLSSYEGPYTHEEILVIMATPEWTDPTPTPPE